MNKDNINSALEALALALSEDGTITANSSIAFKDEIYGKGIFWAGRDYTKQLALAEPDRIFSSEHVDLSRGKEYKISNVTVLSETELGSGVTKSSLKQVGRLKGLIVDGSLSVNQWLYFDANTDRLGLGTEQPNAALTIAEDGIEVLIGTDEFVRGFIGTHASHDFDIKTDATTRITVSAGGDIKLGNEKHNPIQVSVHGKLSVGVKNPDPNVDLHVKGSVRFNNKIHATGSEPPRGGNFNEGDIVWNSQPRQKSFVGWVCTKAGNPGIWSPFGEIR
jgi:hypothetical protein